MPSLNRFESLDLSPSGPQDSGFRDSLDIHKLTQKVIAASKKSSLGDPSKGKDHETGDQVTRVGTQGSRWFLTALTLPHNFEILWKLAVVWRSKSELKSGS